MTDLFTRKDTMNGLCRAYRIDPPMLATPLCAGQGNERNGAGNTCRKKWFGVKILHLEIDITANMADKSISRRHRAAAKGNLDVQSINP
jgi:hypothetical protein